MSLSREAIVEGLRRIVGPDAVVTDEKILVESSVDNFRKLQNIFDVHTAPVPAAVVLPADTAQVAAILTWANENGVNVIPRTGAHGDRGRARERRARLRDRRRVDDEPDRQHRPVQHAGHLPVRRAAAGARGPGARARPDHRPLAAVQAGGPHGWPGRDAQHRPVLDAVRRHRGHGRRPRGRVPGRRGRAHQERAAARRRPRHPSHRDRQRGRALLHQRGDRQAVPVLPREQHVPRLDAQGHGDRLRRAPRRDGQRLQAVGGAGLRPGRRRHPLLALRRRRTTACCCSWPKARRASPRRRPTASRPSSTSTPSALRSPASTSRPGSTTSAGTRARSPPRTSASARRTT